MRKLFGSLGSRNLYVVVTFGVAALASAPAVHAQSTVEEVTVVGRSGADRNARSLSQAVNYSDLDLTQPAQQDVLRRRVNDTARSLCDRLGERGPVSFGASCRDAAVRDSNAAIRTAIAEAPARKEAKMAQARAQQDQQAAMAAEETATPASATVPEAAATPRVITNGPVPDTPENRAAHGGPNSRAGQATKPRGN